MPVGRLTSLMQFGTVKTANLLPVFFPEFLTRFHRPATCSLDDVLQPWEQQLPSLQVLLGGLRRFW